MYEYKVKPFVGVLTGGKLDESGPGKVAKQLQALIAREAVERWEFYSVGAVIAYVKPGCLGGILGRPTIPIDLTQVVFRRELTE